MKKLFVSLLFCLLNFNAAAQNGNGCNGYVFKFDEINVLIPEMYYAADNFPSFEKELEEPWLELYINPETEKFELAAPTFIKVVSTDTVTGVRSYYVTSANRPVIYIKNKGFKTGEIYSVKQETRKLWPGSDYAFSFKGNKYKFVAKGTVGGKSDKKLTDDSFAVVSGYKLYLVMPNNKKILVSDISYFDDTFAQLIWTGDIDGDGKPDFIFNNSAKYSYSNITLLLSSLINNGKYNGWFVNVAGC